MEKSFVDWLVENVNLISTLWSGISLTVSLTLNTFFPSEPLDFSKLSTDTVSVTEDAEPEYLYNIDSDALDAIDALHQDDESEFEGLLPNADEVISGEPPPGLKTLNGHLQDMGYDLLPEADAGISQTEIQLDEIELPTDLVEESDNTVSEISINEESEENEVSLTCFQDYYLSHGRPQELADEYAYYWSD